VRPSHLGDISAKVSIEVFWDLALVLRPEQQVVGFGRVAVAAGTRLRQALGWAGTSGRQGARWRGGFGEGCSLLD
jgi:hypothetical protein